MRLCLRKKKVGSCLKDNSFGTYCLSLFEQIYQRVNTASVFNNVLGEMQLRVKPSGYCMLGKRSASELHPQPNSVYLVT